MKKYSSDEQEHQEARTSGTRRIVKAEAPLILFAEDSAVQSLKLKELLESAGYRTIATTNGHSALERARADNPDLILLDFEMPVMNGVEACAFIKAEKTLKDTPVLIITAHENPKNLVAAFDAGCIGYISKGSNDVALLSKIAHHLPAPLLKRELRKAK